MLEMRQWNNVVELNRTQIWRGFGKSFHDLFGTTKAFHLLDLLANLGNRADQFARVIAVVADDLPDLGATSQNVMGMARKSDRLDLGEDVAGKRTLQGSRHLVVRSDYLQGVKVGEGFDGTHTRWEDGSHRIAR